MKTLGLDLGTNSIGWAIVDESNKKILDSGVRIFPEGVEPSTIGSGDKEQSKNASRRESRQRRRHYYRKRLRKIKLLESLIEYGMCPLTMDELKVWKNWDPRKRNEGRKFPESEAFNNWLKLNPYELRVKGVNEDLELQEFGRVLYHLIQRRGFLSSRKDRDTGAIYKGDDEKAGINETLEKKGDKTLGEFLNDIRPKDNTPFQLITDKDGKEERVRARYTLRRMYVEEFDRIWKQQADNLGLDNKKATFNKTRYLEGSRIRNRNKLKIDHLIKSKGAENVKVEEKEIGDKTVTEVKTTESLPLKEFLGGEIWYEGEELKFESNESVLFWQRPLRSQKSLLGKCSLESREFLDKGKNEWITVGPTPCPLSHPDFERFRAWKFINTIEIASIKGNRIKSSLTDEQRHKLYEVLNQKQKKKFSEIPKKLGLSFDKFNYSDDTALPNNKTISQIENLFDKEIWNTHYNDIWHCFYFYDDNDKLFKKLTEDYNAKLKEPQDLDKIRLEEGYAGISLKAIRNILPFIEKGYKEATAVVLGGVRNAFGERWDYYRTVQEEIEGRIIDILKDPANKEGEAIERIKKYLSDNENGFSFEENDKAFQKLYHHSQQINAKEKQKKIPEVENLRNPIVQHAVNELRRLVNDLLEKHDGFDQIHVEMGRNLKAGKKARQEITNRIKDNTAKNDKAREKLTEFGLSHTRDNIQKYLLFKEIQDKAGNVVCPYTNKSISFTSLLGGDNLFQIEHIIPRSVSLDDSIANKTLCDAKFNQDKGEKTPYQFYKENSNPALWGGAESWDEVAYRAFRVLPYGKAKRFTAKKDFDKGDFIERQLNDTRYISKKAKEILKAICDDVRVMPGSVTSELRHLWGLNNVLQPVHELNLDAKSSEDGPVPHYAVLDSSNKVNYVMPIYNDLPLVAESEMTITGGVTKQKIFKSQYLALDLEVDNIEPGAYWARLKVGDKPRLVKRYINRPAMKEDAVTLLGNVNKEKFKHNSLGRYAQANGLEDDKKYYAQFSVIDKDLEIAEKNNRPKAQKDELVLYGQVRDGFFHSYIYKCKTNLPDDSYWLKLKLDYDDIEYFPAENLKPDFNPESEIVIASTINDEGKLTTYADRRYSIETDMEPGMYWGVFEIKSGPEEFTKIKNEPPKPATDERVVEGNVWVDKSTGEIKFDPKKNREDQRHHAVDAIAVALAKQSYLQQLSTYYGNKDEKHRGNEADKPSFDEPWEGFRKDVEDSVGRILVSYTKSNEDLKKVTKSIIKDGYKRKSEGYAVRGQLHKDFVYGKRKPLGKEKAFHIRKSLAAITKSTHVNKIVDDKTRELIHERLKELGIDITGKYDVPKDAFFKDGRPQIYLPNRNGEPVPIKKVRIREQLGNAENVKPSKDVNKYVNPRNNHHVLIYEDENGELHDEAVTLWEVVERRLANEPIYKLPPAKESDQVPKKIVEVLEINDMFLLGLSEEEYVSLKHDSIALSKHLYRVQKISSKYYNFRYHLASTVNNKEEEVYIQSFGKGKTGWVTYNPIKVKINRLGKIVKSGINA